MKKHLQTITRSLDIPVILFCSAFLLILGIVGEMDYNTACRQDTQCKTTLKQGE